MTAQRPILLVFRLISSAVTSASAELSPCMISAFSAIKNSTPSFFEPAPTPLVVFSPELLFPPFPSVLPPVIVILLFAQLLYPIPMPAEPWPPTAFTVPPEILILTFPPAWLALPMPAPPQPPSASTVPPSIEMEKFLFCTRASPPIPAASYSPLAITVPPFTVMEPPLIPA